MRFYPTLPKSKVELKAEIKTALKTAGVRRDEISGCCLIGLCGSERRKLARLITDNERTIQSR